MRRITYRRAVALYNVLEAASGRQVQEMAIFSTLQVKNPLTNQNNIL
jgi:hypothetical protein